MKAMTREQIFDDFAWLLEITDEQLEALNKEPQRINYDMDLMKSMMQAKGNNVHILQLTLCGDIRIAGYIDKLLKYYDSVSWVNPQGKFHLKRSLCHQSQQS